MALVSLRVPAAVEARAEALRPHLARVTARDVTLSGVYREALAAGLALLEAEAAPAPPIPALVSWFDPGAAEDDPSLSPEVVAALAAADALVSDLQHYEATGTLLPWADLGTIADPALTGRRSPPLTARDVEGVARDLVARGLLAVRRVDGAPCLFFACDGLPGEPCDLPTEG